MTHQNPSLAEIYRFDLKRYLQWFLLWTLIALFSSRTALIDNIRGGFRGNWWEPVMWELTGHYSFMLLAPVIIWLCYRFPFEKGNRFRAIIAHFLLYCILAPAQTTIMFTMRMGVYHFMDRGAAYSVDIFNDSLLLEYSYEFLKPLAGYFLVAFLTYVFITQRQLADKRVEAEQIRSELNNVRLESLQRQLQPHFLFNTLHLVSSRMHAQPDQADTILANLAAMLRYSLNASRRTMVSLNEELEFTDLYLTIMKERLGNRLSIAVSVDPEATKARIPFMLLQPLVENAIKHAIEPSEDGGSIEISIVKANGNVLRLSVTDSGGDGTSQHESTGVGLENIRQRLELLYGEQATLEIKQVGPGTAVQIEIPCELNPGVEQ